MTDRDNKGQYLKGHSQPGPGRPKRAREQEYLNVTIEEVTPEQWRKVIAKALKQATVGDSQARKFLAEYIMGMPPKVIELRGDDLYSLRDLLDMVKERDVSPAELFEAMMQELADHE